MNYGFRFFETHRLYEAGQNIAERRVWQGEAEQVDLALADELYITIPRGQYERLDAQLNVVEPLLAPVAQNQELGSIRVSLDGELIAERPLVAVQSVAEGGLWRRFSDGFSLWFDGLFED